jgi:hypothetical protein
MTTQKANIVIGATDRASQTLMNIAARFEKVNRGMASFGKLTGLANVTAGLNLVNEQMGGIANTWGRFKSASQWSAAMLAGTAGVGVALGRLALSSVNAADKVGDLAERYRISSESLQLAGALVEESGGSMEDAAASIGKLTKAMNEAIHGGKEQAAAFAGVGLSINELKLMRPEQVMERMADAFKGSERDMAKQAVLLELMGRNGTVMMSAMNQGGQAWRDKLAEMRADGRVFSQEQLSTADAFDKAWRRATGAFDGIKNMLGLDLAKALLPIIERLRNWAVTNREVIQSGFQSFVERIEPALKSVGEVLQAVWAVTEKLAGAFKWLGGAIGTQNAVWLVLGGAIAAPLAMFGLLIAKVGILTVSLGSSLVVAMTALGPVMASFALAMKGTALSAVTSLTAALPALQAGLAGTVAILGKVAVVGAAAFAGWQIGTLLNDKVINPGVQKLTGDKNASLGTWIYDKLNPETVASTTPRMTAAQAALVQRQDIRNIVTLKIDAEGRPRVTEMKSGSPQTQIDVMGGLSMVGA